MVELSAAALQSAPMMTQDVELWFEDLSAGGSNSRQQTGGESRQRPAGHSGIGRLARRQSACRPARTEKDNVGKEAQIFAMTLGPRLHRRVVAQPSGRLIDLWLRVESQSHDD